MLAPACWSGSDIIFPGCRYPASELLDDLSASPSYLLGNGPRGGHHRHRQTFASRQLRAAESQSPIIPPALAMTSTLASAMLASHRAENGGADLWLSSIFCRWRPVLEHRYDSIAPHSQITPPPPPLFPPPPPHPLPPLVVPQPCALKIAAAGRQRVQHRFEIPPRRRYLQPPPTRPQMCPRYGGGEASGRRAGGAGWSGGGSAGAKALSDRQVPAALLSPDSYLPSILPPVCHLERRGCSELLAW